MFKIILLGVIFFSSFSYANQPFNVFVKREFNGTDSISGFGATAAFGPAHSLVKGEFISSLNYAEVLDDTGIMREFLSLDTGVRLGVYDKFFVYIEAGFDAFEIIVDDSKDDDHFYDSLENNRVDGYAGLGAGINTNNMRVEGFVKARQIDGDTWDSDKQIFYGVQLSLYF
jgi:hypothetical protein